jgi:hypothetical protein
VCGGGGVGAGGRRGGGGGGAPEPPPPEIPKFDKAEQSSQFRWKYTVTTH